MPRRRPPSRRSPLPYVLIAVVVAAGVFFGLKLADLTGPPDGGEATAAAGNSDAPQQLANGPLAAPAAAGARLNLKLDGTTDAFTLNFGDPPRGGLLFDLDTGAVLWRHQPKRVLPIASVTKIMTALVVDSRLKAGDKVKITKEALAYQGSGVGVLPRGKWIGVSAMLYGLMLPSGNDAAIALAQRVSGTTRAFVDDMNARAAAMGLTCTRYSSPSGFTDKGNHSCAADLAVEARALLDRPRLAKIVSKRQAVLPFPIKGGKLYLYNHNYFLKEGYPGTLGIKTGYTDAAGKCFVVAVKHGGRRYGVVLLNSPDPSKQARQLLSRAYALRG